MSRAAGGSGGGRRPGVRRRTLLALVTLLSAFAAVGGPTTAAVAAPEDPVKLPVLASRLPAGASCTGESATVAEAVPWEQVSLQLARTRQSAAGARAGAGVKVAVVDTGVSLGAPALAGRVTAVGGAGRDCVGHGTFVASLIAAAPVDGVGFSGAAGRARIVAVR
ncbi:S8 family serine peptidase, partial [Streptomyces sp. NPDC002491]